MNHNKRFKTPNLRGLHVLIQDDVFIRLGELSCKLNQKRSALIRNALVEFLNRNQSNAPLSSDVMTVMTSNIEDKL